MPLYEYNCSACDFTFTEVLKVDDRNQPIAEPCPDCHTVGSVTKAMASPRISYSVGDNIMAKAPDGFKDVLREIKKKSGRSSTIDV